MHGLSQCFLEQHKSIFGWSCRSSFGWDVVLILDMRLFYQGEIACDISWFFIHLP